MCVQIGLAKEFKDFLFKGKPRKNKFKKRKLIVLIYTVLIDSYPTISSVVH